MRSVLSGLLLALLAVVPAPAQTLADSLPADVLVYFRSTGSFDDWMKSIGAGAIWDNPFDSQDVMSAAEEGFSQIEQMMGFEGGSVATYLKSIKSVEGALYRIQLTDDIPEMEFAVVFETPMADQIYKLLSGTLTEQMIGDLNEQGELEVTMDEFGLNIAQREDRIVLASDQRRLRDTMANFGKVRAGSLAQSANFKFVTGSATPRWILYSRLKEWIRMGMDAIPPSERMMAMGVTRMFGVRKLECIALSENTQNARFALKASAGIPLLQVFSGGGGSPALLENMPADSAFGLVFAGDIVSSWKKASQVLMAEDSPIAGLVESGIMEMEKEIGLKPEDIAKLGKGGFGMGMVPDENGRLDDDGLFVMVKLDDPEQAARFASTMFPELAKKSNRKLDVSEEGSTTWYRFLRGSGRMDTGVVISGNYAIVGPKEYGINAALAAVNGNRPTLKSAGTLKGLRPKAQGYMYVGLRGIMANEQEFVPALPRMKDSAGIAASVTVNADSVVVETNRTLTDVFSAFAMAGAYWESVKAQRNVHRENLTKIGKKWKEYVDSQGKAPTSLVDLGFSGENALQGPVVDGKKQPGSELYVLLPPTPGEKENSWNRIRAYCKDTRFGRLILNVNGYAYAVSDARFKRMMADQKKAMAPKKDG